ncbi:MAG TPA: TIGR03364 family FAD-dependent oxidoreductase [Bryobacteraceae bacterium]|nr:TIGR03364 family FAD-dependent oxidoreductase [Bryobacteraceae bacterium]
MPANRADIAIVGAGILGLAHAFAAASRGLSVVVFERSPRAAGASVRNFGMIWPIGQPAGEMHHLALRSREIWLDVVDRSRLPYRPTGSLHVTYRDDEAAVAREFAEIAPPLGYDCHWLAPDAVLSRSQAVRSTGLCGGLWSPLELTVDPRSILAKLPAFLAEQMNVEVRFGCAVRAICLPVVEAGGERWQVDRAIICSGDDFATLYPELLRQCRLTRCKLQMMRTPAQPGGWQLGPSLAAGLTLRYYPAFRICSTLPKLQQRIAAELPDYDGWGIHLLVSQTEQGELTLGDSHEYGLEVDIFDKAGIDDLILRYARSFLEAPTLDIAQRWHGVYATHPEKPFVSIDAAPGVHIVTATGGSGMTLSFGLAEQTIKEMEN